MSRKYTVDFVRANRTDTVLTDENIKPSSPLTESLDLGFISATCSRCEASLYLSADGVVLCLNACFVSGSAIRQARDFFASRSAGHD